MPEQAREGDPPTGDPAADEAYDGLGAFYDFFWEVFGRHSYDDQGATLVATVHFGTKYDNAYWDGRQLVFGDGDQSLFNRFTIALDVIAAEAANGLIAAEKALVYQNQSGALTASTT